MAQRRSRERQATQARDLGVSEPSAVTLADGLLLYAHDGDAAVVEPILEDRYELNELDFVRATVRPGDVVVDLGAHIGAYTLRLARLAGSAGHVVAVEACAAHVACLRRSVTANRVAQWTDVVHAAASNRAGTVWLRHPAHSGSPAHGWIEAEPSEEGEPVRAVRIDDLVPRAHFIKADVEGAEGLALRGAQQVLERSRPTLLVELHPHLLPLVSGETAASLIAWLCGFGYECRLLGAGRPTVEISDTPSHGVTSAVFLPVAQAFRPAKVIG